MDNFLEKMYKNFCPVAATLSDVLQRSPEPGSLLKIADDKPLTRPCFASRIWEWGSIRQQSVAPLTESTVSYWSTSKYS